MRSTEVLTPYIQGGLPLAKVLVIEDEANVRVLLDMLLRSQGYEVILADNGWTGLQRYYREQPDVILLDLKMPKLDGIAVLKQIRNVDLTLPVIVLTGDTAPEREREVRELGASEFMVKGSSLHSLGDTLKRLLKTLAPAIANHPGL